MQILKPVRKLINLVKEKYYAIFPYEYMFYLWPLSWGGFEEFWTFHQPFFFLYNCPIYRFSNFNESDVKALWLRYMILHEYE